MELIFSYHAIQKIEERKISLSDIYECIANPTSVDTKHDQFLYKKLIFDNKYLLILPCRMENSKYIT